MIAFGAWNGHSVHSATGGHQPIGSPIAYVMAVTLLLIGMRALLAIVMGVPRLTADSIGLRIRYVFHTVSAPWAQLGPFNLTVALKQRKGRDLLRAVAPVTIASKNGKPRTKTLIVQDVFNLPLDQILSDVAARFRNPDALTPPIMQVTAKPDQPRGVAGFRWPWLTLSLLVIFIAIYVIEQRFSATSGGKSSGPTIATLTAFGGLSRHLVASGQLYRLFTAPFLHLNVAHLTANCIAFALSGYALERLLGRAWMFSIFTAGSIAGSIASLAWSSQYVVSVGASGAIMAMLTALFMTSFRLPPGRAKVRIQIHSARIAIPALIPIGGAATGMHIDYGAHFGGALTGAVIGLILLRTWQDTSPLPRFQSSASMFAAIALVMIVGSAATVAMKIHSF